MRQRCGVGVQDVVIFEGPSAPSTTPDTTLSSSGSLVLTASGSPTKRSFGTTKKWADLFWRRVKPELAVRDGNVLIGWKPSKRQLDHLDWVGS